MVAVFTKLKNSSMATNQTYLMQNKHISNLRGSAKITKQIRPSFSR